MTLKESKCSLCGAPTARRLWCDKCLEPYREKGKAWEATAAANKIFVKKRKDTLGW